jgi:calmodulin
MAAEDKVAEHQDVFAFFDKKGDGTISTSDLGTAMRALNLDPTEEEIRLLIADVDSEGNGSLDLNEFLSIMAKYKSPKKETESDLLEAFKVFDKNESGVISADELKHILTNLGEALSEQELEDAFFEANVKGDGNIKYEDFIKIIMSS